MELLPSVMAKFSTIQLLRNKIETVDKKCLMLQEQKDYFVKPDEFNLLKT